MLYVSERLPDITVKSQKVIFSQKTGEKTGTDRRIYAEFRKGGLPEWAVPIAEATFAMPGKSPEILTAAFLSSYDSDEDARVRGWTPEEKALIEAKLDKKPGVLRLERPRVTAPLPNWIKLTTIQGQRNEAKCVEKALALIEETGLEHEHVRAFEVQEGRKESAAILAALEALKQEVESETLIEA